jgi:hypothetical protein
MFYKRFFIGFMAVVLVGAIAIILNKGTENESPVVELNTGECLASAVIEWFSLDCSQAHNDEQCLASAVIESNLSASGAKINNDALDSSYSKKIAIFASK